MVHQGLFHHTGDPTGGFQGPALPICLRWDSMPAMDMPPEEARSAILLVISRIPPGQVASYGQVAALAGLPGRARLVGRILSQLPKGSKVPWFRVINAAGRIAFAEDSPSFGRQKRLLQQDGVEVEGARVKLKRFRWSP